MKKISKKLKSVKPDKYFSLNGRTLKKIKGGAISVSNVTTGNTDRVCSGGCSATAAFLITSKK